MDLFGKKAAKRVQELEFILKTSLGNSEKRIYELETLLAEAQRKLDELGYDSYAEVKAKFDGINREISRNNTIRN